MTTERTEWKSPVSGELMQEVRLEGITVHFDAASGGYWLKHDELETLAQQHHTHMQDIETGDYGDTHQGRLCPQDAVTELREIEFGAHSGIKVDICPSCRGLWLDGGELQKMLKYLESLEFGADIPHEKHNDDIKLTDRVLMFLYQLTQRPPLY